VGKAPLGPVRLFGIKLLLVKVTIAVILLADVFANRFLIQANRVYTVSSRPEVIAPIGLVFQVAELVEHPNRRTPLDRPNELRNRHFRWHHHKQVNVVNLDVQFDNLC